MTDSFHCPFVLQEKQIMYWATDMFKDMAPTKGSGPFPVHLAQVSLADASIVSTSVILCPTWECPECSYNTTCPATLDFA